MRCTLLPALRSMITRFTFGKTEKGKGGWFKYLRIQVIYIKWLTFIWIIEFRIKSISDDQFN